MSSPKARIEALRARIREHEYRYYVLAAPTGGAEHAHQLINTGSRTLKYLGISTSAETEVVEYPDSGKFGVTSRYDWASGKGGVRHLAKSGDKGLGYYDGES